MDILTSFHKQNKSMQSLTSSYLRFTNSGRCIIQKTPVPTKLKENSSNLEKTELKHAKKITPYPPSKFQPIPTRFLKSQLAMINSLKNSNSTEYFSRIIRLPFTKKTKTLVIDLDETLTHTHSYNSFDNSINFSIRPYALELLEFASQFFEVIVFTASIREYADKILNCLDPLNKLFSMRVYRESCFCVDKIYVKDLRIFRRPLETIVIVDNLIVSFAFQIENGIPITPWFGNKRDIELKNLACFLEILMNVPDVRDVIKSTFKLY